jgi:hypothetical protein
MNVDDDNDLEQWLRQVPLRQPSAQLDRRVAAALHPWQWRRVAVAAAIGLAAGLAALSHQRTAESPRPPVAQASSSTHAASHPSSPTRPVSIVQVFGEVRNDGIVGRTADGDSLRRLRRQTLRQTVLIDPATGQRLTVTTPREEVYFVRQSPF